MATHSKSENKIPSVLFDWYQFMEFLMSDPKEVQKIGPAWPLLFDIYMNADHAGVYPATYQSLAKRYGVAPITVKKWRKQLCEQSVIESYSRGHSVVLRLRGSYLSFLKPASKKEGRDAKDILLQSVIKALNCDALTAA